MKLNSLPSMTAYFDNKIWMDNDNYLTRYVMCIPNYHDNAITLLCRWDIYSYCWQSVNCHASVLVREIWMTSCDDNGIFLSSFNHDPVQIFRMSCFPSSSLITRDDSGGYLVHAVTFHSSFIYFCPTVFLFDYYAARNFSARSVITMISQQGVMSKFYLPNFWKKCTRISKWNAKILFRDTKVLPYSLTKRTVLHCHRKTCSLPWNLERLFLWLTIL